MRPGNHLQWDLAAVSTVCVLAIAVRLPACDESFWIDELHSAWCIWGSWEQIFARAAWGHQSPIYFVGLWIWKQIFGGSEIVLRMTSVLAVAAATAVTFGGVLRWTHSRTAAVAAGFVIALESNSLFFGTELRPYAAVILFSSVAVVCFVRLASDQSSAGTAAEQSHVRRWWIGLVVAVLAAAIVQPTSLGVLAWLPAAVVAGSLRRSYGTTMVGAGSAGNRVTQVGLALATLAVAAVLWMTTLGQAWQQRSDWAAFASATHSGQIFQAWSWLWLLLIPALL